MRIHSQIEEEKALALRALLWISTSFRPLSVQELRHALAVNPEDEDFDEEGLIDPNLIVSVCAGLIAIDTESKTIRLVHFTVDEYFRMTNGRWFPDAHALIAMTCLTYISFHRLPSSHNYDGRNDIRRRDLTPYALQWWSEHAFMQESAAFQSHAMRFLQNDENIKQVTAYTAHSNNLMESFLTSWQFFLKQELPFGVHILAWGGLLDTLITIFQSRITPDRWQSTAERLLFYAVLNDQASIIEFLVTSCNADANVSIGNWHKPLHYAVQYDHVASLEALLRHGAAVNGYIIEGESLLQFAVKFGSAAAVKLLLAHGANANLQDQWSYTPLFDACMVGNLDKAQILLNHGADPNKVCIKGRTALHVAVRGTEAEIDGRCSLVETLLRFGSHINATDERNQTPLHRIPDLALHSRMIDLLLQHGADPEIKDTYGTKYDEYRDSIG